VPASAADDRDACENESGDKAIAACTRAINSGRYSGRQLSVLFTNRCAELPEKNENDKAIEDAARRSSLIRPTRQHSAAALTPITAKANTTAPSKI